jgi:hypothetical protein
LVYLYIMNNLRQIIKESLLLEKRIAQISSQIEVTLAFDIDRSQHAYDRRVRDDIEDYDKREVSNGEISELIRVVRKEIAEKIVSNEIVDDVPFIIKSPEKRLAITIIPKYQYGLFWVLLVTTVFRETYVNPFRVGRDQLVIWA